MKGRGSVSRIICNNRVASTFRLYNIKPTKEDKEKLYNLMPVGVDESEMYKIIEDYIVKTYHIK